MQPVNGFIATEPFKTKEVQTVNMGGFAKVGQKHSLTPLKVVMDSLKYPKGSTVYVRGETCKAPWANEVYSVDGVEFILVPENTLLLVKHD